MVLLLFLCSIWLLTLFISNRLEHEMTAQLEAQQFASVSYIADSIETQVKFRIDSLKSVAARITPDLLAHPHKLEQFLQDGPLLTSIFQAGVVVISPVGIGIADSPILPDRVGGSVSDFEYFKEVVATGRPAVGKPRIGRFSKQPVISFAVPVLNSSGQLIAVLAGHTLLSDPTLLGSIEDLAYKHFTDRLILVSPKYRLIITGSDPTRTMTPIPETGVNPWSDRFMSGGEGSGITVNSRGVKILLSAKQIPTPGWYVRLGLPAEMAYAPIRSMKNWAYAIALGLSLISSLLVWLAIRQALKPLYAASKLIQDITEGKLPPQDITVNRDDEVGQLLTSFNLHLNSRKTAEEALQIREEEYRRLYDSMQDAFATVDMTGHLNEFNQTFVAMLGYTAEELRSLTYVDITPEKWHAIEKRIIDEEVMVNGYSGVYQKEYRKKNGTIFPVELNTFLIRNSKGQPIGMWAIVRDITERKKAEDDIRKSKQQYDKLVSQITIGTYVLHSTPAETFTLDYVSPKMAEMFNVSVERLLADAQIVIQAIHPDDRDYFVTLNQDGIRQRRPFNWEGRVQIEGKVKWLHINSLPESMENGDILWYGIVDDINERKLAEIYGELGREVLQILNEPGDLQDYLKRIVAIIKTRTEFDAIGIRLQDGDDFPYVYQAGFSGDFLLKENSLLERAADGGACRDKDGCLKLECLCGLVICGKTDPASPFFTAGGSFWTNDSFPLLDIPPSEDPRLKPRNECIHEGYASIALTPIRDKNRIIGLIQLNDRQKGRFSINRVKMLEGIASHIGAALMRKKAENEKAKLEAQLYQSQKMESIGILAGGVAHDFNNILMAIVSYGYMTKEMLKDNTTARSYIEEILDSANRASELTRGLLAFSRKQTITPVLVDLNEIVRKIEKILCRLIREDIKLSTVLSTSELPVLVDAGQIELVLINLATNARDAMPDGGDLVIKTEAVHVDSHYSETHFFQTADEYAVLTVSDTGVGIDKENTENIFEPFFTTKEVGKGTGLGLSIAYGIIKQHNGNIRVYSEAGHGTTFKIYLPMAEEGRETVFEPKIETPPAGKGETIIIAEDEPQVRKSLRLILQHNGYKIIEAENGADAVRKFQENRSAVSLILLDVIMPVKNGREAYEKIKSIEPSVKTIFMSGYTDDIIAKKGLLEEGFDLISKPINPDTLIRKIRDILDR